MAAQTTPPHVHVSLFARRVPVSSASQEINSVCVCVCDICEYRSKKNSFSFVYRMLGVAPKGSTGPNYDSKDKLLQGLHFPRYLLICF